MKMAQEDGYQDDCEPQIMHSGRKNVEYENKWLFWKKHAIKISQSLRKIWFFLNNIFCIMFFFNIYIDLKIILWRIFWALDYY